MPSFRTVFAVAAVALAGVVSALPFDVSARAPASEAASLDLQARCACNNVPNIVLDVQAQVVRISAELNAVVAASASGTVDISTIGSCLDNLQTMITTATVQVKALVGVSIEAALTADGKVWTITECAGLLVTVFTAICNVLTICMRVCATAHITTCATIVASIGVCLSAWLTACFSIIATLQVEFCSLISVHLFAVIGSLKLTTVVSLLGLQIAL